MNSINIIMSVIGLNLWINFQLLKSAHQQLQITLIDQFKQFANQLSSNYACVITRLLSQIADRDKIVSTLRHQQQIKFTSHSQELMSSQCKTGKIDNRNQLQQLKQKYQQVIEQNKQYQIQFAAFVQQMKTIKSYLQQLKRVRSMTFSQPDQSYSPAHKLVFQEQEQILTKINSLNRFQKITASGLLDTIRQVTQLSAHSEQSPQQYKGLKVKEFQFAQAKNPHYTSQSFQCTNQIQDITNIFYQGSRQLYSHGANQPLRPLLQSQQLLSQSLSILKNYCSKQNVQLNSLEQLPRNSQDIVISFGSENFFHIQSPKLILKSIVNQRYLVYENGFVYTGNTISQPNSNCSANLRTLSYVPMGFGQLYFNNKLYYCGHWKNGLFDGWGKMYFKTTQRIKTFSGKWKHGVPQGPGSIKFWNSQKFVGQFINGAIMGQGLLFKNRELFGGYWENNCLVKNQQ